MPLFTLTLLAVGVGVGGWRLVRPGSGGSMALPSLRLLPLPLLGLLLQFLALRWAGGPERLALIVASQSLLLAFCLANWRYSALRLLSVGFMLNLLPMLLNGGYMPITPEAMRAIVGPSKADFVISGLARSGTKDLVLPMSESNLGFLGDVFVLPYPFMFATAFSPGDVLILLGFGAAVHQFTSQPGGRNGAH